MSSLCFVLKLLDLLKQQIRMRIEAYILHISFVLFPSNSARPTSRKQARFINLMQSLVFTVPSSARGPCHLSILQFHNEFTGDAGIKGVYSKTHFSMVYGLLTFVTLSVQTLVNSPLHSHNAYTFLYTCTKGTTLILNQANKNFSMCRLETSVNRPK